MLVSGGLAALFQRGQPAEKFPTTVKFPDNTNFSHFFNMTTYSCKFWVFKGQGVYRVYQPKSRKKKYTTKS